MDSAHNHRRCGTAAPHASSSDPAAPQPHMRALSRKTFPLFFYNDVYSPLAQKPYLRIFSFMNSITQTLLGDKIRSLRKELGVSQESFALSIRMDRTYYSSIESGKRNLPLSSMMKIASGFGLSLSELLDGIEISFGGDDDFIIPVPERTTRYHVASLDERR